MLNWLEAQNICICEACPTYLECGETLAFCMLEASKSKCIKAQNGCLCPGCPVQEQMEYKYDFYCLKGPAKSQIASQGV